MPYSKTKSEDFRLGEWLVRPALGRLVGPEGDVPLEPRAMEVLLILAEHAEQVVSRQQIIDAVWRREYVGDGIVSGVVSKLRKALGDDDASPRYIETLAKRGYRLLARMGYLDQSLAWVDRGLELAERVGHHSSTGYSLAVGFICHAYRHETEQAARFVDRTLELATEHGLSQWIMYCRVYQGTLELIRGEYETAIQLIGKQMEGFQRIGAARRCARPTRWALIPEYGGFAV